MVMVMFVTGIARAYTPKSILIDRRVKLYIYVQTVCVRVCT
jgi:hypothetical protein